MQIATPFSTLFSRRADMDAILDLSDAVELRQPGQQAGIDQPLLFHSELSLASRWSDREKLDIAALVKDVDFELISFHLLSRYQENLCVDGVFQGQGIPYSRDELCRNVRENLDFLRGLRQRELPILLENNNDLTSDAYQIVTEPEFISAIVREFNLFLLWDIAHAGISAFNKGIPLERYLNELPLEKCLQVHLSRFAVHEKLAYDAHDALTDEEWFFFENWLSRLPRLRYVTIEYYKDASRLAHQLTILRTILNKYREFDLD